MRVATWNCRGGSDLKLERARIELHPDLLVLPESKSGPTAVASGALPESLHHWTPAGPPDRARGSQGLGVFGLGL